ncbi:MAG: hypothetical protein IJ161_08605 [Bacteroidales bacterium]|nr:hypothetical protein [Bacteroidales bacterium]
MKRIAILFIAALAIFSCSKEKPLPDPAPSVKDEIKITSGDSFTVSADGGKVTVQFSSSGKWSAALSNDRASGWLTLGPTSGEKGSSSLTLNVAKSEESDERSATVRITCGSATVGVTVTQKQRDALTQTPSKTSFPSEGGSFTVEVKANIAYSFGINADWIHRKDTKALVTESTTFTVDRNEDTSKREGTITVKSTLGSETITIYQEGEAPSIILSSESVSLSAEGGTFTVEVNTNVDVTMSIDSGAEWLSEVPTKAMSTHSYTFSASANGSASTREGRIRFKDTESSLEAFVSVTQAPSEEGIIVTPSVYEIGAEGGSISVEVSSSVDPKVEISEAWVRLAETKSMTTKTYLFSVDPNSGYASRECRVTFSGGSAGTENFTDQSPWSIIGTIGGDTWTRDIGMKTNGTWHAAFSVAISSSDEFKFRQNGDWSINYGATGYSVTTVSASSGVPLRQDGANMKIASGTYDIYLNPSNAVAYFIPEGGEPPFGGLSATVTIIQEGQGEQEITFTDPVLEALLIDASPYESGLDTDWDGRVTNRDLAAFTSVYIGEESFSRVGGTVRSLEDLKYFTATQSISIDDGGERVSAPLPESISSLSALKRLRISNCGVFGPIPSSYGNLKSLIDFDMTGCKIEGEFPTAISSLPKLETLILSQCPLMRGKVLLRLSDNSPLSYINLTECDFESLTVEAPSEVLLGIADGGRNIYFAPQKTTSVGNRIYRCITDGTAEVHADGETVLYHEATAGPGIDIFLTGDGFTAENNTVGGTMETYLKHCADFMLSMEPFDKLAEYFNIWLIYAHSQKEGTGISWEDTEGLKFGCYQTISSESGYSTACIPKDLDYIKEFVRTATGRTEGTVAMIMNSPYYGGLCFQNIGTMSDPGISVACLPCGPPFAYTFAHETLGHGFAHLADEYDSAWSGRTYDKEAWNSFGMYSNVDGEYPPRWRSFVEDSRYEGENLGYILTGGSVYRPVENSIMRSQREETGHRFNAPSREAIWQRVQVLANPDKKWNSWEEYISNGYNREEFIRFDLGL